MMDENKSNEAKSEESEHESEEDESEILEESPCGRWLKRSEEVSQRNVPGIDRAYLAMDSEEGVEVVWNEVQFSERKSFKQQEEKIKAVFDNLMRIEHANIVKFHRYWIDYQKEQQKTRVVFITEYMSSGSVKEFLNKTKEVHKYKRTKSWKRWCTQILSALSYLHTCVPPVIHGNMTCDTIFIQHNGLVKIGSVAPDAIRNHVKTYHEVKRHMHYYAPEYETAENITPAVDIYSFGICALEMAVPNSQLYYTESKSITAADIQRAIDALDNPQQQDFIRLCLRENHAERPSARSLLLHPLLFEVHSLKLLAAHAFVKNQRILPEYKPKEQVKEMVVAETTCTNPKKVRLKDVPAFDVDKFLEDVLNGVYPLTSFALPRPPWAPPSSAPPQNKGQVAVDAPPEQPEEVVPEARRIIHAQGTLMPMEKSYGLILQLRFEDKMNRHLNCDMMVDESAETLASELVQHKLINDLDKLVIKQILEDGIKEIKKSKAPVHFSSGSLPGSDSAYDVPAAIASVLQPASQPPLVDNTVLFYQGLDQMRKQQTNMNGAVNPLMQQVAPVPHQLPMFQSVPQAMTSPPQSSGAQPQVQNSVLNAAFLPQGTLQQSQSQQAQQVAPNASQTLDQANIGTNIAFTQQVFPTAQAAQIFPLQYLQLIQQQQAAIQQQQQQTVPNLQTQMQPMPSALQAQLLQQQMLAQMQPLYAQQQQPLLLQQSQPQVLSQVPAQRQVHLQSVPSQQLPAHGLAQPGVMTQATIPGNVLPMLLGQQPVLAGGQNAINPAAMLQMQQQLQARLPAKVSQMGDIQRSTSLFNLPPQQPQAQSSNNSNNTGFSRSVSRVEDGAGQILLHATPHSSIVSVGSSVSDHDMTGTNNNKSPPTSTGVESAKAKVP